MLSVIDRIADLCGRLAGWLFFLIGAMIAYEVVARYAFNAPTIWAEEMSRFCQIWAVYLAAAYVLRHGHLIRITLFIGLLPPAGRRLAEAFSLVVIAAVAIVAIIYGTGAVHESIALDRNSSTMLEVPMWMSEIAIPLGCLLLTLQCVAQLARLWRAGDADFGRIEEQM